MGPVLLSMARKERYGPAAVLFCRHVYCEGCMKRTQDRRLTEYLVTVKVGPAPVACPVVVFEGGEEGEPQVLYCPTGRLIVRFSGCGMLAPAWVDM